VANAEPVVLAVNNNFPDALSGQYAAGILGTGILLTNPDAAPLATLQSMQVNGVQTVFVLGGLAVIFPSVATQLTSTQSFVCGGTGPRLSGAGTPIMLNVKGLAGPERYATNLIANTYFPAGNVGAINLTANVFNPALRTAFVVTGTNFADSVSAGPLSAEEHFPIILTDPNTLSPEAIAQFADLGIQQVIVLGGPNAVTAPVVTAIQAIKAIKGVIRVFGTDRTGTAACLAALNKAQTALPLSTAAGSLGSACVDPGGSLSPVGMIWGNDNIAPNGDPWNINGAPAVGLARGDFYADALGAGPFLGGFHDSVVLLTLDPNTLGATTTTFLNLIGMPPAGQTAISGLVAFGGPAAITDATLGAAQAALSA
jgi:hypothetical protein